MSTYFYCKPLFALGTLLLALSVVVAATNTITPEVTNRIVERQEPIYPHYPDTIVAFCDLHAEKKQDAIVIYCAGTKGDMIGQPLLVQNVPADFRPSIHPIKAPESDAILTENGAPQHSHETGLFVGFADVNKRDFFHNRDGNYFRRKCFELGKVVVPADGAAHVSWTVVYEWLGKGEEPILVETQRWTFADHLDGYILDLDWSAEAVADLTFGRSDEGGLFLRVQYRRGTGGKAVNNENQRNEQADGQRANWINVAVPITPIDERATRSVPTPSSPNKVFISAQTSEDWGHIVIFDHKDNPGHPVPWRVDNDLGVGPSPGRLGEWKLAKGETTHAKYRLFIFNGKSGYHWSIEGLEKSFNK